jgi:hypothetical protein
MKKIDEAVSILESLSDGEIAQLAPFLRKRIPPHPLESKWNIGWERILDAIARSNDISQRGIRGLVAECVFESGVLPELQSWNAVSFQGDLPFDFKLQSKADPTTQVTVQVKLQRTIKGLPLMASDQLRCYPEDFFIVEVQKTRSGEELDLSDVDDSGPAAEPVVEGEASPKKKKKTRPYHFGDFDILAVSMQPSTSDWSRFMYTVSNWLLPKNKPREREVGTYQPVSPTPNEFWTDDLQTCIDWLLSKEKKSIFDLDGAQARYLAVRKEASERRTVERTAQKEREKNERMQARASLIAERKALKERERIDRRQARVRGPQAITEPTS